MFCIIFYHTARIFKALGFYPGHQLAHLVQVALPNPYPVGGLGMNMQYAIKTEDIQNKGEGKGGMDNAASVLMAISTKTSTIFALPEAT